MVESTHMANWWPNFYEPLRTISQKVADWVAPRSDASSTEDCYEISVELPGVKIEDVEVSVHDKNLVIRGEKRFEREEKGRTYFFSEREYGSFERSFRLPPDANSGKIDAAFNDGVLSLKITKTASAKAEARKIEVHKA